MFHLSMYLSIYPHFEPSHQPSLLLPQVQGVSQDDGHGGGGPRGGRLFQQDEDQVLQPRAEEGVHQVGLVVRALHQVLDQAGGGAPGQPAVQVLNMYTLRH